jgi:hypothetical protein
MIVAVLLIHVKMLQHAKMMKQLILVLYVCVQMRLLENFVRPERYVKVIHAMVKVPVLMIEMESLVYVRYKNHIFFLLII